MADETPIDNLTPAQHNAVFALLNEPTIRKAAAAAGVPERSLYHWLKQPTFAAEYQTARREATRQAIAKLQQVSGKAATRLEYLLTHGTPAVQLGAARAIMEFSIKAVELEDLATRLAVLEALYAAKS
jgi:hypothetical protein